MTSISDKFSTFCTNIRIEEDVVKNISYRYKRMTRQLNVDFWANESETSHSLYVGSYGRGSAIHVSDIDMLFQLQYADYQRINSYSGNGQSALLQEVKNSISKTFSSYIKADGQVIVVEFTDGVIFEILPCFVNKNGSFTYPDTNEGGRWRVTDPKAEIETIRLANENWNNNLKRLCRMARSWKDSWSVPIGGLLIDTLAYNFLEQWKYNDESFSYYDWMTRDFFEYLKDQDYEQEYWHAPGSNQKVFGKGLFQYKALRCYHLALEAISYENKNYEYSANEKWRDIYGNKFPI